MSQQQKEKFEAELQFHTGDRINFSYVMGNQILTLQKAMLEGEIPAQIVTKSFVSLLPDSWKDEQFKKDVKDATITTKVDNRPLCCGDIHMNEETCKKIGIEPWKDKEEIDYFKLQQACLNLLERRHLLLRKTFTEKMTGKKYHGRAKDIKDKVIEQI